MRWLEVDRTWNGDPAEPPEHARVGLARDDGDLVMLVEATVHGDPPPPHPPGHTPQLWEHEVVELFLVGPDDRYLEVELGPAGHHLVLLLDGVRTPVTTPEDLDATWSRVGDRWSVTARLPAAWLPPLPWRANAYAIHGVGARRRYLAHSPVPGDAPDFHRLHLFPPLSLEDP